MILRQGCARAKRANCTARLTLSNKPAVKKGLAASSTRDTGPGAVARLPARPPPQTMRLKAVSPQGAARPKALRGEQRRELPRRAHDPM